MRKKLVFLMMLILFTTVFAQNAETSLKMTQELATALLIAIVYAILLILAFIHFKQNKNVEKEE